MNLKTVRKPSAASSPSPDRGSQVRPPTHRPRTNWLGAEVLVVAAVALAIRAARLDRPAFVDELNHVLAARSLLTEGTLEITEGGEHYTRAWLFTYLVAGMFRVFGESLAVGRVPAVLAGAAAVVLLFAWLRHAAGRGPAWAAAALLALNPLSVYMSQLVRFYSLQTLLFLAGAIAVYALVNGKVETRDRVLLVIGMAVVFFGLSYHLQATTLIGMVGVGVGTVLLGAGPLYRRWTAVGRPRAWIAVPLLGGSVLLLLMLATGFLSDALGAFRTADVWAEADRYNPKFYHWFLVADYPTLWPLFPLLALSALIRFPRLATYCLAVFGVALVLHSLAAWKSSRFITYALPFLFAVMGMGGAAAIAWIGRETRSVLSAWWDSALGRRIAKAAAVGAVAVAILFAMRETPAFGFTQQMVVERQAEIPYGLMSDWGAASPLIASLAESTTVVLSSDELKAVYYLGHFDFDIQPEYLAMTTGDWLDAPVSPKTGRPWLITGEAFEAAFACFESGLIVSEEFDWTNPAGPMGLEADLAAAIEQRAELVPTPRDWYLRIHRWSNPDARWNSTCQRVGELSPIPERLRRPAAQAPGSPSSGV